MSLNLNTNPMKKQNKISIYALVIMGLSLILTSSCKKDNDNSEDSKKSENSGIVIKGEISTKSSIKAKGVKSTNSLTLADAKKILVFSKGYYSLTDIVNNTFSVTGQINTGVALIFLDANNHYIGNLSSQGLNMLPLGNMKNGENTQIDLSTLTLVGNSVVPSHDPLGNEIIISATEINSLKNIGAYYESIAKNIDTDNDGIPDVLSNKQLVIYNIFGIYAGHFGRNDTKPVVNNSSHYYINYQVEIDGGSALTFSNSIVLSGPTDDPYSIITTWGYKMAPDCGGNRAFIASFGVMDNAPADAPWGTAFLPFRKGTYTLTLDGKQTFTLDYSNLNVKNNLVIVTPTIHTNSEGKLTSITFEYKLPDGTIITPASMLTNVMVQLSTNTASQFYNSSRLTSSTGFSTITLSTPIDISTLYQMDVWYDDLLGNQYDIIWR